MSSHDVERTLALRICTTVTAEGETLRPFVRCPRSESSADAHACAGCLRMRSIEWDPAAGGEVRCLAPQDPARDVRADFAEVAARTRVHELAAPVTTSVTADVSLERLEAVFASARGGTVVVVDPEGRVEGIVTRRDLGQAAGAGTVRDLMTGRVYALPENAPVTSAVSLFAFEDITEAPVVRADGTLIAMCHAQDVMRWVAGRLGFAPLKT